MKLTPAQVKNLMRRGLRFLVDPEPEPEEKQRVWRHFQNSCAYCGAPLNQGAGDMDHLISAALGGANALANRVLSCKQCNAVEKRDRNWVEFLKEKSPSPAAFENRKRRIDQWVAINGSHATLSPELLEALRQESERTTKEYDAACSRIRLAATHGGSHT
jgi:hypothetical protein